jgi:hypothetical protein
VRRQVRWTAAYQAHDYDAVRKLVHNWALGEKDLGL